MPGSPPPPPRLDQLKLWHRFHLRLTAIYAIAAFVLVGVMSWLYYRRSYETRLEALQGRLLATAVTTAQFLDAEALQRLARPEDADQPAYRDGVAHFRAILERYPKLTSLYVLLRTETPGTLRFALDWSQGGVEPSAVGDEYDASDLPSMLAGLEHPTVESEPVVDEFGASLSGYAPVLDRDGRSIGLVGVDVDASEIRALRRDALVVALALFAAAAALLTIVTIVVARSIRRPLRRTIEASNAIARGDLGARLDLDRRDEFGLLSLHFNQMAKGLEEREFIRETFGRYVSPDVAATLLADRGGVQLGGEEREVTVLFSDLCGYSTISEKLSATQVVTLLNAYLAVINEVIDAHQGCVIEYLGDGVLAVFGAPNRLAAHPEKAVRCALAMRERLEQFNRDADASGAARVWRDAGLPALTARIGIHTGVVVAGSLGSPSRMKYGVIGDNVNVAARIEALNKDLETSILASDDVLRQLPEDLRTAAKDRGEHPLKGRARSVHVFSF
ncbi:MAG: HAMP domain-containing protein [Deltaproteobacteria bacterium]|nr:HAMP domain-containing protein [Deltaproteobacteria bacterium]